MIFVSCIQLILDSSINFDMTPERMPEGRFDFRIQIFSDEKDTNVKRDPILRTVRNLAENRIIIDSGKLRSRGWSVDHADGTRTFVLISDSTHVISRDPRKPKDPLFTNDHYESIVFFDTEGSEVVGSGEMVRDAYRERGGKIEMLDMHPKEVDCRDELSYKGPSLVERRRALMQQFCARVLPSPDAVRSAGEASPK